MVGKKEKYIAHFNEVYDKTFFAVRRFVALKCGDIDDIPDIIQEVYLEYYKMISKKGLSYAENEEALLIAIAKRKLFRYYGKKQSFLNLDDMEEDIDGSFDERLIDGLEADRIWAIIEKEPREVRKIFYLAFFEEMSHSQIAEALGCSVSNVKNKIYRTIKRIRSEEKV